MWPPSKVQEARVAKNKGLEWLKRQLPEDQDWVEQQVSSSKAGTGKAFKPGTPKTEKEEWASYLRSLETAPTAQDANARIGEEAEARAKSTQKNSPAPFAALRPLPDDLERAYRNASDEINKQHEEEKATLAETRRKTPFLYKEATQTRSGMGRGRRF